MLTHVEGLKVASRTSSFAYKNDTRNIRQIARRLRVANILEGSVRKVGDSLRITAQLIDTRNDRQLWSNSYDRDMTDIFQVQAEIANAIVSALTIELGVGLQSVSVQSATTNLDAYDLYLKARELFIARVNLPDSWQLLEQATHMDPQFSRAWETLAAVHSVATSWFPEDEINHPALALAAAHQAIEIDPDLSMAYAVIGMKHQTTGEGYAGAIRNLDVAIENPLEDHSARIERFKQWGATRNIDVCDMNAVAIALQREDCFPTIANARLMWQPDTAYYRKTPAFKEFVNAHLMAYWQQNGFPSQCQTLDEGEFACD